MSNKVQVITIQIAVDDHSQGVDTIIDEIKQTVEQSATRSRFKRYTVTKPVSEDDYFAPEML